jgi:hypothetical protein
MENAEAWMEAFDASGNRVAQSKGNWFDLHAGKPVRWPPEKSMTLRPTGEECALEIAGKFDWDDTAWLAGEGDPPSLRPGRHLVRASVGNGVRRTTVFEWDLDNPGSGQPLQVSEVGRRRPKEVAPIERSNLPPTEFSQDSAKAEELATAPSTTSTAANAEAAHGASSANVRTKNLTSEAKRVARQLYEDQKRMGGAISVGGEAAKQCADRAADLLVEGEKVKHDLAVAWRRTVRRLPFPVLSQEDIAPARAWNAEVLRLADTALPVEESADVQSFPVMLPNLAGKFIMAMIDSNLATLERIKSEGEKAVGR